MGAGSEIAKLWVAVGADVDDFIKDTQRAFKGVETQVKNLEKVGTNLTTFLTLPALAAGVAFTKMASDEDASAARLKVALTNSGNDFGKASDAVYTYIAALERASGFDDSSISDALANMTTVTKDARLSVQALGVTLDLARQKGMDLEAASTLVGKALNGNTERLKLYGINLREGARGMEVLTALTASFGGASQTYIQSAAGHIANLKNQSANAAEEWGRALYPMAMRIVGTLTAMAEKAQDLANKFKSLSPQTQTFILTMVALAVAVGPAILAFVKLFEIYTTLKPLVMMLGSSFGVLTTQLIFLAGVALVVAANWEKTGNLLKASFYGIATFWAELVDLIIGGVARMLSVIPGIGHFYKSLEESTRSFADVVGIKFTDAASAMESGGSWMGNTMDMIGGKMQELMGKLSLTAKGFGNLGAAAAAAAGATNNSMASMMSFGSKWATAMTNTVKALSDNMVSSMATAMTDMTMELAMGTGKAGEVFLKFLLNIVSMMINWAITALLIAAKAGEMIAAALSNPWTAALVVGIGLAAVVAIGAAYRSQVAMADGGVVTGPTNAMVGEAGPEAVIPLSSPKAAAMLGGSGGEMEQTIIIELDGRTLAEAVVEHLPHVLRMQAI